MSIKRMEEYKEKTIKMIREQNLYLPHIWDVIGISEREYHTNGSAYQKEINDADRALYYVRWAWLLFGWKVCGMKRYDRICELGEHAIPSSNHKQPSKAEREAAGGYGTPIDWAVIS